MYTAHRTALTVACVLQDSRWIAADAWREIKGGVALARERAEQIPVGSRVQDVGYLAADAARGARFSIGDGAAGLRCIASDVWHDIRVGYDVVS